MLIGVADRFALDQGAAAALKRVGTNVPRNVPIVDIAKREPAAQPATSELVVRDASAADKRAAAAAMQPYYTILSKGLVKSVTVVIGLDTLDTNQAKLVLHVLNTENLT